MTRQTATRIFLCLVSLRVGFEIVANTNELIDVFCCLVNSTCCGRLGVINSKWLLIMGSSS